MTPVGCELRSSKSFRDLSGVRDELRQIIRPELKAIEYEGLETSPFSMSPGRSLDSEGVNGLRNICEVSALCVGSSSPDRLESVPAGFMVVNRSIECIIESRKVVDVEQVSQLANNVL